jgi:ABC-type Na+ transport system ATPase subunit NatA
MGLTPTAASSCLTSPRRGVDVEAKAQIYAIIRQLAAEGRSVIFVSSEIEELPLVCDRVLVLRDGSAAGGIQITQHRSGRRDGRLHRRTLTEASNGTRPSSQSPLHAKADTRSPGINF